MAATALGKTLFLRSASPGFEGPGPSSSGNGASPVLSVPGRAAAVRAGRTKTDDAFHGGSVDINH